jgi:hypothetical protein
MISLNWLVGMTIALLVSIEGLTQIVSPILVIRPWFRFTSFILGGVQPDFDETRPDSMMCLLKNDPDEFKQRYRGMLLRLRIGGCIIFCLSMCGFFILFNSIAG